MLKSVSRLRINRINTVLVCLLVAGAIFAALTSNWFGAALLLACGVAGFLFAVYVRRPESNDIDRLNAFEYRDERDRRLAGQGFAAVGVTALIISLGEFIFAVIFDQPLAFPALQFVVLTVVLGRANQAAVKQG